MNFTQLLGRDGNKVTFNEKSMRLTEVDAAGKIINSSVRFQFDRAQQGNAKGMLTFMAEGKMPADSTRIFHLYPGSAETIKTRPLVHLTDGVQHRDQESFKIETPNGTYYYHKQGAGFASIFDKDGNDWLGYRPGDGPAGEYRGIPNMGYPEGYCHPG
jgi:hypothetical protein